MTSRIRKCFASLAVLPAVIGVSMSVQALTGQTIVNAETGNTDANFNFCGLAEYNLSPAVGCMNSGAPTSQGNHWHIPLNTLTSSSATVSLGASAVARGGSQPNPFGHLDGRLLAWNNGGVLLCATTLSNWDQFSGLVSKSLGICTANWQATSAVAEFSMAHTTGMDANLNAHSSFWDPSVFSVTYNF